MIQTRQPVSGSGRSQRRWRAEIVDELIAHPDVWHRIAQHAEAAAAERADEFGARVLTALRDCAAILSTGGAR